MPSTKYWIFLVIVFAAIGYSMWKSPTEEQALITSPSDRYSYEFLTLDNQLPVLLVQAPDQSKAAAAMTVNVGSGNDPADREGLAHFLEHMLFLGTEPFPEPGEYQDFISRHGGNHNAFTSFTQTTYFFEIDNDELVGALDRFAPFFISPTFDATYIDREKNAVHAEYSSKIREDFRRIYAAEKEAYNPENSYSQFSTGNLKTLADRPNNSVRDAMLAMYQEYYSANNMALVVSGNHSLEQLKQWTLDRFTAIPVNDNLASKQAKTGEPIPLFTPGSLPLDMQIQPVKELRRLQFTFPMPETRSVYQHKPLQILSNLLGHEGNGSLLAVLKKQGWAESLSAGQSLNTADQAALVVQIQLTLTGLDNIEAITDQLFTYVDRMTSEPLPAYLLNEQQQLNDIAFQYKQQTELSDYAVSLSINLLRYPSYDAIYGDYRIDVPDHTILAPYLAQLRPDNMLRTLIAPDVNTDQRDPYYSAGYSLQSSQYRPTTVDSDIDSLLYLPKPNPFIPEDFQLYAETQQPHPVALVAEPNQQVWFFPEDSFTQPRSQIYLRLQLAQVINSVEQQVLAQLYSRAINESLNSYSYPAYLAGLTYSLSASTRGLQVNVGGYQDKLSELLKNVLEAMQQPLQITPEQFEQYRASLERSYENQLKDRPFRRTLVELKRWLSRPSYTEADYISALNTINIEDVKQFAGNYRQSLASIMLIHGQINQQQALDLSQLVTNYFPATADIEPLADILQAPVGQYQRNLNLNHPDNAKTLYIQGHDTSDRHRAEFGLLAQILSSPYYQYMRTEQQLGYIVFATAYPQQAVPALAFIVQSPTASPQKLMDFNQVFFEQFSTQLNDMSEAEFGKYKEGLITLLTEKPKNMSAKAGQFWQEISGGRFDFASKKKIAKEVEKIQLSDIQKLYQIAIIDRDMPQLLFSQGGTVKQFQSLKRLQRETLPAFPKASLQTSITRADVKDQPADANSANQTR